MYYIVYLSAATRLFSEEELKEILIASNKNNQQREVTGLLLYSDGNIIQVIEGERETVKALYTKISYDARHHNIIKLDEGEVSQRNFPDWSMGFRTLAPHEFSKVPGFTEVNRQSFLNATPSDSEHDVLTFLKVFYKGNMYRF